MFQQAAEPFITRTSDFYAGVEVVLRALFQHPEFLYRVEIGAPVANDANLFKLNGYEVAARLSYALWSSTPSEEILAMAEQGKLDSPDQIRVAAMSMLASPRAVQTQDQFHALWLGYSVLPHAQDLTTRLRTESMKLVERTLRSDGSWLDLFRSTDTYVDAALAKHYGLPAPSGVEGWVGYGNSGRQGLLSHGSFLSMIQDNLDTSPTRRGKRVPRSSFARMCPRRHRT